MHLTQLRAVFSYPPAPSVVVLAAAVSALGLASMTGTLVTTAPSLMPVVAAVVVMAVTVLLVQRIGATNTLLHALVLSVFVESIHVGPLRVGRFLSLVVALTLIFKVLGGRWSPPRIPVSAWLAPMLFFMWSWASGWWAASFSAWAFGVGGLALAAAYFLAFALFVTDAALVHALVRTYVVGALVLAAVALVQLGLGQRAIGLQGDANIFALYQAAAIPAAGMLSRLSSARHGRVLWLLAVLPLCASVLATQSRGGLFSMALVLLACAVRGDFATPSRASRMVAVAAATPVLVAAAVLGPQISERLNFARVREDRGSGRLDIWRVAWRAWSEHPLLGLGSGNFERQSSQLLQTTPGVEIGANNPLLVTGIRAHSVYVESLVELGPVGLALWSAILVSAVVGLRRIGALGVTASPWSAVSPMILTFAIAAIFLSVNNNKLLWMLLGLTAAAQAVERHDGTNVHETRIADKAARPPVGRRRRGSRRWARRFRVQLLILSALALITASGLGAAALTAAQPVMYRSTSVLVAAPSATRTDNEALLRTLAALAESPPVLETASASSGVQLSPAELAERVEVERPPDSSVLKIVGVDMDRSTSREVAQAVVAALILRVGDLAEQAVEGERPIRVEAIGDTPSTTVVRPPVLRNAVVGCGLGGLLAACGFLLLGRAGSRPSAAASTDELTQVLRQPVTVAVPFLRGGERATAMDLVHQGILSTWGPGTRVAVLGVVRPQVADFCLLLAAALASSGQPVRLVDLDVENGYLTARVGADGERGLAECLVGGDDTQKHLMPVKRSVLPPGISALVSPTGAPMHLLARGQAAVPPSAFAGTELPSIVESLEDEKETVIFVAPPVPGQYPVAGLLQSADRILLLVVAGHSEREHTEWASQLAATLPDTPTQVVLLTEGTRGSGGHVNRPSQHLGA